MLVTSNKYKKKYTEWENLNILESLSEHGKKLSTRNQGEKKRIVDEYTKLSNTFSKEFVSQIEIFSKIQESYINMYSNCIKISYNSIQLGFDMYTRFTSNSNIQKNKRSD